MDEKQINARFAMLCAQRNEALDKVVILAAENAVLQEQLEALKAKQEENSKDE